MQLNVQIVLNSIFITDFIEINLIKKNLGWSLIAAQTHGLMNIFRNFSRMKRRQQEQGWPIGGEIHGKSGVIGQEWNTRICWAFTLDRVVPASDEGGTDEGGIRMTSLTKS